MVPGTISHVEASHEISGYTRFLDQLSAFCCAVPFDKRGYGLSDRVNPVPMLEDRLGDITAVADAVGASRFMLCGWSEGGSIAAMYAAAYPNRVDRLVIFDAFHKFTQSPDSPHGVTPETLSWMTGPVAQQWGTGVSTRLFRSGDVDKREVVEEIARLERNTMSPGALRSAWEWVSRVDVRDILPTITVPTLLLNREDSFWSRQMTEMASMIPGAVHVTVTGSDHAPWGEPGEAEIVNTIREFTTGQTSVGPTAARSLATVMFTDIVNSTAQEADLGDRRWGEILDAHDRHIARAVKRFRGEVIKSTGDGALAIFDAPGRAVDCGVVLTEDSTHLGLTIRIGLHTGEIERRGDDISGLAVNLASRIEGIANPGTVAVSRTVTDLVIGSPHRFTPIGSHNLKGVPGEWDVFEVDEPH